MKAKIKKKSFILVKHREGCNAVAAVKNGSWDNPWSGIPDEPHSVFFANVLGYGNGHTLWIRIKCNDNRCPAIKAIHTDVLNFA